MVGFRGGNRYRSLSIPALPITFVMDRFKVQSYDTFFVWNVFTEKCIQELLNHSTYVGINAPWLPFMESPDVRLPFEFDVLEIMNSAFLTPIGDRFDFDLNTEIMWFDSHIGILQPWYGLSYPNVVS